MPPIKTPLSDEHERLGARMVEFARHWMPIQYTSILDEAAHVRRACGLFDLCHMGRVRLTGEGHLEFIDRLVSCDVMSLPRGGIRYGLLTRDDGTVVDDLLVYRAEDCTYLCINAANRSRDLAWIHAYAAGTGVEVHDLSTSLAMIAVQGPRAATLIGATSDVDLEQLPYYHFTHGEVCGIGNTLISRNGYTGEDGFELWLPADQAPTAWRMLLQAAPEAQARPIGLGARDTLRLEAGMPLYGHEIDDSTTPLEAGLHWAVKLDKEFVGAAALRAQKAQGLHRRLVGFVTDDKRVPRQGYGLFHGADPIGTVVSGAASPALGRSIGTGFVPAAIASPGTRLSVDFRGKQSPIEIVRLPFYKRTRGT